MAGPGIGFENLIERGMGDNLVLVHRAANALGNLRKVDAAVDEGFNGDFVGGIEYGGKGTADFARFARELERGETFGIWFFESEAAEFGEIGLDAITRRAVWIGEGVLNGQAHVRRGKLREHRTVYEFNH